MNLNFNNHLTVVHSKGVAKLTDRVSNEDAKVEEPIHGTFLAPLLQITGSPNYVTKTADEEKKFEFSNIFGTESGFSDKNAEGPEQNSFVYAADHGIDEIKNTTGKI